MYFYYVWSNSSRFHATFCLTIQLPFCVLFLLLRKHLFWKSECNKILLAEINQTRHITFFKSRRWRNVFSVYFHLPDLTIFGTIVFTFTLFLWNFLQSIERNYIPRPSDFFPRGISFYISYLWFALYFNSSLVYLHVLRSRICSTPFGLQIVLILCSFLFLLLSSITYTLLMREYDKGRWGMRECVLGYFDLMVLFKLNKGKVAKSIKTKLVL